MWNRGVVAFERVCTTMTIWKDGLVIYKPVEPLSEGRRRISLFRILFSSMFL